MVIIREPPGEPSTIATPPSRSTMVGVMEDNGRLPGAIVLGTPCTRPNRLALPGLTVKSSISSFSRNPAPGATTPAPKMPLMVNVTATALPLLSITE